MPVDPPLTQLLNAWRAGDQAACAAVAPHIYSELRALAGRQFRRPGLASATFEPTALVHEAWLKLADATTPVTDRQHFFALAALTMRGILVDRARAADSAKRGGGLSRVTFEAAHAVPAIAADDVLLLDDALNALKRVDERAAQVIELHYFGGLEREAMAALLGLSLRSIDRALALGRAWLARALS
jgi:RNA polymerase sigma factor (TIGR02999 family)